MISQTWGWDSKLNHFTHCWIGIYLLKLGKWLVWARWHYRSRSVLSQRWKQLFCFWVKEAFWVLTFTDRSTSLKSSIHPIAPIRVHISFWRLLNMCWIVIICNCQLINKNIWGPTMILFALAVRVRKVDEDVQHCLCRVRKPTNSHFSKWDQR